LRTEGEGRCSPFPGRTYPTGSVTGMPSAVSPFSTATWTRSSATWRSKSRAIRHSPSPAALMPVLSTRRFNGPFEPRQGVVTAKDLWRWLSVLKSGTAPVEADRPQQALDEPGRLPEGHAVQGFQRQARLDRGIAILRRSASLAGWRRHPHHVRIEPDRKGATVLQRVVVGWPVSGLAGRRDGPAHADQLPCRIHEIKPPSALHNKAL
jgi:hypothetical protein